MSPGTWSDGSPEGDYPTPQRNVAPKTGCLPVLALLLAVLALAAIAR